MAVGAKYKIYKIYKIFKIYKIYKMYKIYKQIQNMNYGIYINNKTYQVFREKKKRV